jgi:hypothetical protein
VARRDDPHWRSGLPTLSREMILSMMMWMYERAAAARLTSSIVSSSSVHALCRRLTRTPLLGQLFVMPLVQQQQQQMMIPGRHSSLVISAAHRLSETIHAGPRCRSDPPKHGGQPLYIRC